MTIERIHFEEDVHLSLEGSLIEEVHKIVEENADKIETLSEGEYNLTPSWWEEPPYTPNLIVLEDGTGVFRAIFLKKDEGSKETKTKRGGTTRPKMRIVKIPEDEPVVVVAGPLKSDKEKVGICEIILYSSPHKSPKSP